MSVNEGLQAGFGRGWRHWQYAMTLPIGDIGSKIVKAMNFEPQECVTFVKSMKIDTSTHENKAIHSYH